MKKDSGKLSSGKMTAYEKWELPLMGESSQKTRLPATKLPTAAELQAVQKAAYAEGFEEGRAAGTKAGFEQGHREGLQAGKAEGLVLGTKQGNSNATAARQAEIDQQLLRLQQLMDSLQFPLQEVQEQSEEAIVNLVLAVSRAVIFRDLQLDRSQIVQVVSEALAALPDHDEQAVVSVHPEDLQLLKDYLPAEKGFRFSTDAKMMAGGCRVETRHSLLDFTVEKRFQTVVQQMLASQGSVADDVEGHDFSEQMGAMTDFHRDVLESGGAADD